MDLKRVAKATTRVLISYLTYEAVRTVIEQLSETNKPLGFWLHEFSSREKIQDGEAYVRDLLRENQELAFRVMTVREHLALEVAEYLPEMVCSGVKQSNIEVRRGFLEQLTRLTAEAASQELDAREPET